jgi:hypothetical protein
MKIRTPMHLMVNIAKNITGWGMSMYFLIENVKFVLVVSFAEQA